MDKKDAMKKERERIIDENGIIENVMPKVKPDTNAADILAYLDGEA